MSLWRRQIPHVAVEHLQQDDGRQVFVFIHACIARRQEKPFDSVPDQ
jgi:hypothetical protein